MTSQVAGSDLSRRLARLSCGGVRVYVGADRRRASTGGLGTHSPLGEMCHLRGDGRNVVAFGRTVDAAIEAALARWDEIPPASAGSLLN